MSVCDPGYHPMWLALLPVRQKKLRWSRHRYEETGTKRWTNADGLRAEKRCVRYGNTIWRRP